MTDAIQSSLSDGLVCPLCGESLHDEGAALCCLRHPDHRYPILRGVPRFVSSGVYARSFGFEWNVHRRTQLDSFRADHLSEDEFKRKTGLTPDDLRGKRALDAGVGAGRYADVMSRWQADVIGVDLSDAVDAARENLHDRPNVRIVQADIADLPFLPRTFDVIVSIGVLHHTPDAHAHFKKLVPFLKPGGVLAIWVYPSAGDFLVRQKWIPFTSRIPTPMFYAWCRWFVPHARLRLNRPFFNLVRRWFPFSVQTAGMENDILDTFDGFSPRYHSVHSEEEVADWFREEGFVDVTTLPESRVSVRGRLPV